MTTSVLIPFHAEPGGAGETRRAVRDYIYEHHWTPLLKTGEVAEVVYGQDLLTGALCESIPPIGTAYHAEAQQHGPDGDIHLFSVSRALNDAADRATATAGTFVLYGADHIPDPFAIAHGVSMASVFGWSRLYRRVHYAASTATKRVIREETRLADLVWSEHEAPCPGVLAVRARDWRAVCGMDERYEGWGYEDTDLVDRLTEHAGVGGPATALPLRELWTGESTRDLECPNKALYERLKTERANRRG